MEGRPSAGRAASRLEVDWRRAMVVVFLGALLSLAIRAPLGSSGVAIAQTPDRPSSNRQSPDMNSAKAKSSNRGAPLAESSQATSESEAFLDQHVATRGFSLGRPTSISLSPDGKTIYFLRSGPRSFSRDLYAHEVVSNRTRLVLSAESLLGKEGEVLSAEELARRERARSTARGLASYDLSKDGKTLLVPLSGRLFVGSPQTGEFRELKSDGGYPIDPRLSPDAKHLAVVRDGELYVRDLATDVETRLTPPGGAGVTRGLAEFVAQEEMGRFEGYWWSPDSEWLAYQETDESQVEELRIGDPLHPEKPPRVFRYPRPGKANATVRLRLVSRAGGEPISVEWDHDGFPYLAAVEWKERLAPLTIVTQNRAQTELRLLAVDLTTGDTREIGHESDAAWINLQPGTPRWLASGEAFLWLTERDGAWRLESRKPGAATGQFLTEASLGLRRLVDVDEKRQVAIVLASPDPTQMQVYEAPLDPSRGPPWAWSDGPGQHSAVFSANFEMAVETYALASGERAHAVVTRGGKRRGELESVAERPPFLPRAEFVEVGESRLRAVVIRPRDFDAAKRYPVIVHVYGGPHAQMVTLQPYSYLMDQWMADRGYIVVSIDGRGTPSRGRDWERAIQGNFIDAPLADQVAGLQALGSRFPEMDLGRVGVYGWSFGGYFAAMAVARRGDVFHAAVAGAPVSDWLDYDTHYTERYLGVPEGDAKSYEASSVLTYIKDLRRPLLLIHGTADDNVYFSHSLKIANELLKLGLTSDFLPLAGHTHMVADPTTVKAIQRRTIEYFDTHVRGKRD